MPSTKLGAMLALSFAVGLLGLRAQAPIQIQLQDGSTLSFPAGFDQIVQLETSFEREVVMGLQTQSQVRIIFVHTRDKIPFQPEKILAEALNQERLHLEPVTMPFAQGIHRNPINRLISEGGYNQLLLAYDRRYYHGGGAFFFLLGTNRDFFEHVSVFEDTVDQFRPGKPRFDMGIAQIPFAIILGAILVLGMNMWIIFRGFKEMARMQA